MGRALRSIVDQQSSAKGASKVLKKLLRLTQMDIDEIIGELEMDDYVLEEKGVLEYMALLNFEFQHINVGSLLKKGTCVLHDKSRHGKISCDGMPDKKLLAEVVSLIDSHIKQIGNASMRKCQEGQGGKAEQDSSYCSSTTLQSGKSPSCTTTASSSSQETTITSRSTHSPSGDSDSTQIFSRTASARTRRS